MVCKKWFLESVDFLWKNRKELAKDISEGDYIDFEFGYGNMPFKLANRLPSDFVDVIQDTWYDLLDGKFKTKKQFIEALLDAPMWNPNKAIK